MTEITARLSTALADRYKIERHLGEVPRVCQRTKRRLVGVSSYLPWL